MDVRNVDTSVIWKRRSLRSVKEKLATLMDRRTSVPAPLLLTNEYKQAQ
jgi:hypothetical protein